MMTPRILYRGPPLRISVSRRSNNSSSTQEIAFPLDGPEAKNTYFHTVN